jgi:hypothetical protein
MLDLLITGIVLSLIGAIHAMILAVLLSSNMGDFWPIFQKAFLINAVFYCTMDWIQQYLKKDLKQCPPSNKS